MSGVDPFELISVPFRVEGRVADRQRRGRLNKEYAAELQRFLRQHSVFHDTHPWDFFWRPEACDPSSQLSKWCASLGDVIEQHLDVQTIPRAGDAGNATSDRGDWNVINQLLDLNPLLSGTSGSTDKLWKSLKARDPSLFNFALDCATLRLRREPETVPAIAPQDGTTSRRLELVLAQGMSSKKQHEVEHMFQWVQSCAKDSAVNTILNIGEGKGYLSRSLALCGGLQVIGLDCNPQHRDTSFRRMDRTLFSRIHDDGDSFLYWSTGEMHSLTCRVSSGMNWRQLLAPLPCCGGQASSTEHCDETEEEPWSQDVTAGAKRARAPSGEMEEGPQSSVKLAQAKVRCLDCSRILVGQRFTLLSHAARFHQKTPPLECDAERWVQQFFVPVGKKDLRSGEHDVDDESDGEPEGTYRRGIRLEIATSLLPPLAMKQQSDAPASIGGIWQGSRPGTEVVVVIGLDEGNQQYKLLRLQDKTRVSLKVSALDIDVANNNVPSVRPIPPVTPSRYLLDSATLKDVGIIGLHTCGNLGSDICRLWATSQSPSLCFVSCCWHALTEQGCPLTTGVASPGKLSSSSLMMATQPMLDRLADDELRGYVSAKRLLFYRALLPLLYAELPNGITQCPVPPKFLRSVGKVKHDLSFTGFVAEVEKNNLFPDAPGSSASYRQRRAQELEDKYAKDFARFIGFTLIRLWLSPLLETGLLLDRVVYIAEQLAASGLDSAEVSLVPIFDVFKSPRNYAILARRKA